MRPGAAIRRGLTLALFLAGCGEPGPVPISYGERECDYCHMTAVQPEYAAELVLRTGKVFVFDDPGCLASFVREGMADSAVVHSLWVNDFLAPDSPPLRVEAAIFLRSDSLRTPMNHGLAALRPGPGADSLRTALGGRLVTWDEVVRSEKRTGNRNQETGTRKQEPGRRDAGTVKREFPIRLTDLPTYRLTD